MTPATMQEVITERKTPAHDVGGRAQFARPEVVGEDNGAAALEIPRGEGAADLRVLAEHGKEVDAGGNGEHIDRFALPQKRPGARCPREGCNLFEAAAVLPPDFEFAIGVEIGA